MMTRFRAPLLASLVLCSTVAGTASAQPPPFTPGGVAPTTSPVVSPYVNLLRRGNPAYLNYYGLVRPEQRLAATVGNVQQQAITTSQLITDLDTPLALPTTGHRAYFLNSNRYFLTQNALPGYGGAVSGYGSGMPGSAYGSQSPYGRTNPALMPGGGLNTPIAPPRRR